MGTMLDAGDEAEDKTGPVRVTLELILHGETDATEVHMQERLAEEETAGAKALG